jgi:hypothetical protein
MDMFHEFDAADAARAEREHYVTFMPILKWPAPQPGGLVALKTVARWAVEYLRGEWGIASAQMAPEAIGVRVAKRDAEDAALGLSIFMRQRPFPLSFVS